MQILYVVYHEYTRLPIHTVEVVEELDRQGHEVTVVTAVSPRFLQQLAWAGRIPVRQVPIVNLSGCRQVSFVMALMVCLPWWCLRRRPDVLYERFSLTTLGTLLISRLLGIPLVVEVNGIIRDELALSRASRWRLWLQDWVERRVFRGCERIVAVTEGIRQWVAATYAVPPARIEAIPNVTNPERFMPLEQAAARQTLTLDPHRPIVGYLGSLFPWCGLDTLVEASPRVAAEVPDVLFLIGGGQEDLRRHLEAHAQRLGMERQFRFTGDVPWDRAASFISAFDVAVAPAQFANTRSGISPQKVYAYLACERPVVGSDIDGLGNVLQEEGAGLSFPAGDAEALARAVVQLLGDPARARAMGQRGRQLVLERYTWEQVVRRTVRILDTVRRVG